MRVSLRHTIQIIVPLSILLSSCQPPAAPVSIPATYTPGPIPTLPPMATVMPTEEPEKTLTVCLAHEPASLYPYASPTGSVWSVLEAIFDGPIDRINYTASPVILEKLPSIADGDAKVEPVTVAEGDLVVTAAGELKALKKDEKVIPSGCQSSDCAITWDGMTELKMDRMTASFQLKPGLVWSDGEPLTADDSVYSFQVAADPATPVNRYLVDRTFSYLALDERTVEWKGIPGYLDSLYRESFFLPLPRHAWGQYDPADLLTTSDVTEKPLGWGPYVVSEWVKGDHITLTKNEKYFRAAEGLPKFASVTYKFLGTQADNNLAAIQGGQCDIVDTSAGLESMLEQTLDAGKAGEIVPLVGQGPEWEQIVFNIYRPSYFDGISPVTGDRPNFFGDVRTRRAFAYCMDRDRAVNKQLLQQSAIPDGFLAADHPLVASGLAHYGYDPEAGSSLLDEVGWKDDDANPQTPRVAYAIPGVPDGTLLSVNYLVTDAYLRQEVVKVLTETASTCGIQINVTTVPPQEMYAPAPDGELFGRKFDMAQIAWQAGQRIPCDLFTTTQIPDTSNQWIGINLGAYSNPAYDDACRQAQSTNFDTAADLAAAANVQRIFADELPAIPLYFHLKVSAIRPDFCGLDMDVTSRSALFGIEQFDFGQACPG